MSVVLSTLLPPPLLTFLGLQENCPKSIRMKWKWTSIFKQLLSNFTSKDTSKRNTTCPKMWRKVLQNLEIMQKNELMPFQCHSGIFSKRSVHGLFNYRRIYIIPLHSLLLWVKITSYTLTCNKPLSYREVSDFIFP